MEPFCGSAVLFFSSAAKEATLSDKNTLLINFLQVVAENPGEVYERSINIPRTKEVYLTVREAEEPKCKIDAAAQFVYLNRNCFNGIFRTNKYGHFNVPYSDRRTGSHPSHETFISASEKLKSAKLVSGDFEWATLAFARSDSFVYLDPPYATKNSRIFTQYNSHSFGLDDIVRLARVLSILDSLGSKFLVSYADVPEIHFLKKQWHVTQIEVQRHISGFKAFRHKASELLISNF